jgi:two-component system, NtrC family, sensor kinase
MQCPRCSQDNLSHAVFCLRCGTPLQRPSGSTQPAPSYADLQHSLTEALEQQTATAEILRSIMDTQTDAQPVFDRIVRSAAQLCHAATAGLSLTDGRMLYLPAGLNSPEAQTVGRARYPRPLDRETSVGAAILTRSVVHLPDVPDPSVLEFTRQAGREVGFRSVLVVPMLREGRAVGAINVGRREPGRFSDTEIELLKTFADQAVIAIENVRLFKELEEKNRALTTAHAQVTEALEQQTATSAILRVIASSPTELQPIFDAIATAATTLCEADNSGLFRFDGELLHFVAQHGRTPEELDAAKRVFPQPPRRHSVTGQAILANAIVQIADVSEDPELEDALRVFRTMLSVPLIRGRRSLGAITVARRVVRRFTDKQISLLKTFADQAVIAIENVRLFKELEARTQELTRSVGELQALGDVGQAISSTLDLQTVLSTIVAPATRHRGSTPV